MTIGYRYTITMDKASGIARDAVENDFYTNTVLGLAGVQAALQTFYRAWSTYRSPSMSGNATIRQYAIPDTPPLPGVGFGPPIATGTFNTLIGSGPGVAGQNAIALSFHADFTGVPEHGPGRTRPRARLRGRMFLGELVVSAYHQYTTGAQEVMFDTGFVSTIAGAASALLHTTSLGWSVFSKKDWALRPVVAGWVDDSPDITRRRKVQPSVRTSWS